ERRERVRVRRARVLEAEARVLAGGRADLPCRVHDADPRPDLRGLVAARPRPAAVRDRRRVRAPRVGAVAEREVVGEQGAFLV
ncbi:MAG: hypothetical protein AVDCRST_MAG30-198, partial [uncultured Solirubrobacteraceae bacterium]